MAPLIRKAQPDCVHYIVKTLYSNNRTTSGGAAATANIDQLVRVLVNEANYAKPTAIETITNAVHDGLLIQVPHSSGRIHESKMVRLPSNKEIKQSTHDFYCFECHLPGILEQCSQCTRSFHRLCYRKDPERPNYSVPSAKLQKNRLPAFSSDTDTDEEAEAGGSTTLDYESDVRATSSLLQVDQSSMASSTTPQRSVDEITVDSTSSPAVVTTAVIRNKDSTGNTISRTSSTANVDNKQALVVVDIPSETESKTKVEVVCLGEVRPPTRKRPGTTASNVSYKSEITPHEDDDEVTNIELCTCCRLLKYAALRNPPNMQSDELCHLIEFTFERNRSWITTDVPTYLETILKLTSSDMDVVKQILFKLPAQRLVDIDVKLKNKQYNYLMEFLVDILDLQHNIGVFFGPYSTDMESTKWLLRDIAHDLSEIRRCSDCFRYSHEKRSSVWFAKPCIQRHELVFAKHSGFPYWPAKVIRVLPNNKYDVRFFGGNHSRALIDVRYIRPIDTDIKSLKLGHSSAIKKAMEELRYHQILSTYPPSKFSFHANQLETEQLICAVLNRNISDTAVGTLRREKKSRRHNVIVGSSSAETFSPNSPTIQDNNNTPPPPPPPPVTIATPTPPRTMTASCSLSTDNDIIDVDTTSKKRRYSSNLSSTQSEQQQSASSARITRSTNKSTTPKSDDLRKLQSDLEDSMRIAETTKKRNEKLIAQMQKLKETIKKHEYEKKILKRKQWCYWCLEEAIYLCCFRAAYCSELCQTRHWQNGHSQVCKNQDCERQASSTT